MGKIMTWQVSRGQMRRRLSVMLVFSFVVSVSFAVTADAQLGSSGGTQASRGGNVESGLGPLPIFSHVGPGADFDEAGASTRVFSDPLILPGVPPAPAADPFTIVALALPPGANEIRTYISWTWLLDGVPPAVDKIMVDGGAGAVEVSGDLVGTGTPDLCWDKAGAASYLADVTGLGIVALGAANSIMGATDKALGVDPEAYGEGLSILLVYEIPGAGLRNVDVYAGYSSNRSGPALGNANIPFTFSKVYVGGELHFFLNAADGQSVAGASGPGFGDDFFIDGALASGAVLGTGVVGDAWQGFVSAGPPAVGPPPFTDWLYGHANDDVQTFVAPPATGMVVDTNQAIPAGDCVGHSLAAVSFSLPPVPTVSEWGLIVMALLVLTAGAVVLGRRRRPVAA